jgi:hypothetical protein
VAFTKEALDRVAKSMAFERGEAAADVHERHFVGLADLNSEAQGRVPV